MHRPSQLHYAEIAIGSVYTFERKITQKDVLAFADLVGDYNPMHVDTRYGLQSIFQRSIVQGMLAGSLFSALVGMHCPGKNCLYLSQTLQFKMPIFPDDNLTVRGTVINKNDSIRMITMKTEVIKNGGIAVTGEAKLKVLND